MLPTNMFSPHLNAYPQENYSQTFSNQNQIPLSPSNVSQNLWQIPQNSQLSQQNSLSWNQNLPSQSNGIQPQNPNGLASLPYISQQLVQDALRMSAPVGSSPNDEAILVQILYESSTNGQTYKQALESLHGINNHAASLWKDYYLDHKPRIDRLVMSRAEKNVVVAKSEPSQSSSLAPKIRRQKPPPPLPNQTPSRPRGRPRKQTHQRSSATPTFPASKPTKRSTINSLTTHAPVQTLHNLLPPQADIVVPNPPSRSPTPPTMIIPRAHGNKYTSQDRDYFIKFISWHLKCDPGLTKAELCAMLAEKAPHHNLMSWTSHWHARHEIADKILAAAMGELSSEASSSNSGDPSNEPPTARRPRYNVDSSSASEFEESEGSTSENQDESASNFSDNLEIVDVNTDDDIKGMGESRDPFTDADARIVAKYIASNPNWNTMTGRLRWEPFEKMYPQRSWKSWAEFYRRDEEMLNRLADASKKRKDAEKQRSRITSQRGRPSWAKGLAPSHGPPKRRAETDDFEEPSKKQKNGRTTARSQNYWEDSDSDADADADGEVDDIM